jgi:predicted TIM-barrel fold metal-dependent hydrolase
LSPAVIAELASKYRDVPGVLGHMGASEYVKQAVAVARQSDNIYLETLVVGWMPLIMEAFNRVGTSKMLYGSDHPYNSLPMEVEKIARHAARAAKLTETDPRSLSSHILAILNSNEQR